MKISFVILTWNSEQYIANCLTSLISYVGEEYWPFEIFIVDNGSKDKSQQIIKRFHETYSQIIKPLFLEKNTGTTYSRNLALKKALGDYIVILDSDIVVSEGFLGELISVLKSAPDVGMVVPKLLYGDGSYQKSTDNFPTVLSKIRRYFFLRKIEKAESVVEKRVGGEFVDYAISAFWIFKKEVLAKVGLLDENIFYAPEDVDYCLRVWKAGFKIVYITDCEIVHDAQEITRGLKINRALLEHVKGLFYYFTKHKYWFAKPSFRDLKRY